MTAVWIALGAVAISLMAVFISLNAAKEAKRRKEGDDGGTTYASDTGDRDRTDSDSGGDGGGDGGGD
ncbi:MULTISPECIES: hypothetical protein [unclassified Sphingomonas]|uniref:hypothetical protein n=1 Tax=unclassified Sphingomonas TaxID=196159 RepID=UPI00082D33BE|nr:MULTISPECIES: hypothetical protein [unclassified Sphingomonas]